MNFLKITITIKSFHRSHSWKFYKWIQTPRFRKNHNPNQEAGKRPTQGFYIVSHWSSKKNRCSSNFWGEEWHRESTWHLELACQQDCGWQRVGGRVPRSWNWFVTWQPTRIVVSHVFGFESGQAVFRKEGFSIIEEESETRQRNKSILMCIMRQAGNR